MNNRLPFTLTPLTGEPFGLWWHTYAARLDVTRTELARAIGIPATTPPGQQHATAIATATGLSTDQVAALFTTTRPSPPEHVLRVWAPQPTSRFCPDCLTGGAPMRPEWNLPMTFYCLTHHRRLATGCPACGQPPPSRIAPGDITADPSSCPSCSHDLTTDLTTAGQPSASSAKTHAAAQEFINLLLTRLRDRTATPAEREQAQDDLTDLTLIALHLTQSEVALRRGFTHHLPAPAAFRQAVRLLTPPVTPPGRRSRHDRLIALVEQCFQGPQTRAIPFSWRAASPTLTTRIARGRDTALTPLERLRYATTLPTATPPSRQNTDPALGRAAGLPDQLWPIWAIRLTDDDTLDGPVFRSAVIAAMLLPHSRLELADLGALLPHRPSPERIAHQLRRLAATPQGSLALRILTELGLALDRHDIPIDYARRRRLVADTDLIDRPTWIALCRDAGLHIGRQRRLDLARRYLYELLTGGNLATAPEPYHLDIGAPRVDHAELCATMPVALAAGLTRHAKHLLAAAGITEEPLTWHPPADWVTVTDWPGADLDHTDPEPIHHALRQQWAATPHNNWAPTRAVAHTLGISRHHLRDVLRRHPIDHAPYHGQRRPGAIIAMTAQHDAPGYRLQHRPGAAKPCYLIDPAWLQEQYLTWRRSLPNIAAEIGCRPHTLRAFAEQQGIPRRPHNGGTDCVIAGTQAGHPAELPEPLRTALHGQQATDRIHRFLVMTEFPSLNQAAAHLGIIPSTLTVQLKRLERACGGPLFQRPHPRTLGPLTPLGEQLCQQARDHFGLTIASPIS